MGNSNTIQHLTEAGKVPTVDVVPRDSLAGNATDKKIFINIAGEMIELASGGGTYGNLVGGGVLEINTWYSIEDSENYLLPKAADVGENAVIRIRVNKNTNHPYVRTQDDDLVHFSDYTDDTIYFSDVGIIEFFCDGTTWYLTDYSINGTTDGTPNRVFIVGSEAEMIEIDGVENDTVIRTDSRRTYHHNGGKTRTVTDWTSELYPIETINGRSGPNVTLSATDVQLENVPNFPATSDMNDNSETKLTTAKAVNDVKVFAESVETLAQSKTDDTALEAHKADGANPHGTKKEHLNLGLLENFGYTTLATVDSDSLYATASAVNKVYTRALSAESSAIAYTDQRISELLGGATPAALDTIAELAAALTDNDSDIAGIMTTLASKADKSTTDQIESDLSALDSKVDTLNAQNASKTALDSHIADTANPHGMTKSTIHLGLVANNPTSDSYTLNDSNTNASSKAVHDVNAKVDSVAGVVAKTLTYEKVNFTSLSNTWMRIAVCSGMANAEFTVSNTHSGSHGYLRVQAGIMFGSRAYVNLLGSSGYGNYAGSMERVRIVSLDNDATYGIKALEIKITDVSSCEAYIMNDFGASDGWEIIEPVASTAFEAELTNLSVNRAGRWGSSSRLLSGDAFVYDENNPPNSAAVGLENLFNYGISTDPTEASTSLYAAASSVNAAWLKAIEALTKSNDSAKLAGYLPSQTSTANTVAVRDATGDIRARGFRSSLANQTAVSDTAALAFRTSLGDDYIRFCTKAGILTWLGLDGGQDGGVADDTSAVGGIPAALNVYNKDGTVLAPVDGVYAAASTRVGQIVVTFPLLVTNHLFSMRLRIQEYGTNGAIEVLISGNTNSSGTISKIAAHLVGTSAGDKLPLAVNFGKYGGKTSIALGALDDSWGYLRVSIQDVTIHHNAFDINDYLSGWDIAVRTSGFTSEIATTAIAPFSSENKPTATDVGLPNVKNYGITSSVTSSSSTTYAAAAGVRTAYNRADDAYLLASTANTTANALVGRMDTAEGDIDDLETLTTSIGSRLDTAEDGITQNATSISSVSATASSALSKGNTAITNAAAAQTKADSAYTLANSHVSAISTLETDVSAAQTDASAGITNAAAAQSKANSAYTLANTANTTANTANSTATTAKNNAATALSTANSANSAASTAQGTANTAITDAAAAQTKADSAYSLANGKMSSFILEDGDGTERSIANAKEVKFIEGGNIDINWTDTSSGTDVDPYDLTFTVPNSSTSVRGAVQLSTSVSSTSTTLAATASAARSAYNRGSTGITNAATAQSRADAAYTLANGKMSSFILEDGDGTERSIANAKEVKFVEGGNIDINWTATSTGSDADPYDLTFTVPNSSTSVRGAVQLSTSVTSTSTTLAATASAARSAYNRGSTGITNAATAQARADAAYSLANGKMSNNGSYTTITLSSWIRTTGSTGWYNATYGGGMYMIDSTYVRVYNSKKLYVANEIISTSNGRFYYSDERLKENFKEIKDPRDVISSWGAWHYNANLLANRLAGYDRDKLDVGFRAGDIKRTAPELTMIAGFDLDEHGNSISGENYLTIDYARTTPYITAALNAEVKDGKERDVRIAKLESEVDELKSTVKQLMELVKNGGV